MKDGELLEPQPVEETRPRSGCRGCLLGCALVLIALVGLMTYVIHRIKQAFVTDPVEVERQLQAVLPCQVPRGYRGIVAVSMPLVDSHWYVLGPEGVDPERVLRGARDQLVVCVVVLPAGESAEDFEEEIARARQQRGETLVHPSPPAQHGRTVSVDGRSLALEEVHGTSAEGARFRQLIVLLPSRRAEARRVALVFLGPEDGFDQARVDEFLASIDLDR